MDPSGHSKDYSQDTTNIDRETEENEAEEQGEAEEKLCEATIFRYSMYARSYFGFSVLGSDVSLSVFGRYCCERATRVDPENMRVSLVAAGPWATS